MFTTNNRICTNGVFLMALLLIAGSVSAGGGGMPWDAAITAFVGNISGPVAGGIALAAIVIAGASLIFGGEMNAFGRSCLLYTSPSPRD